jgi:hypothetical protein
MPHDTSCDSDKNNTFNALVCWIACCAAAAAAAAAAPRALHYADLGGVEDVLADIQELIEYPLKHPEVSACHADASCLV